MQRFVAHFNCIGKAKSTQVALEASPEVLDILWGYYFATGGYGPIMQMIALLPWSDDHDDAARLTVGSMAKYTLARNASHDQVLLAMLKSLRKARHQPKETVKALDDIIDGGGEPSISARIRQQALAAIDELKRKGPAYKRDVSWWGYVGQSTVAAGCIAAAVAGQAEFGLPCVIGGPTLRRRRISGPISRRRPAPIPSIVWVRRIAGSDSAARRKVRRRLRPSGHVRRGTSRHPPPSWAN